MRKSRRIMSVLYTAVCLIMPVFLSGCVQWSGQDESNYRMKNKGRPADSIQEKNRSVSGNLELQIFVGGYGDAFWNEAIKTFKKENPDVNIITYMGPNVNIQMKTKWMSDDPPDFAYRDGIGFEYYAQLISDGKIMDLKEWFDNAGASDGSGLIKDNIYKGLIPEENGKIFSAPYIFGTLGMWYDAKLFKDNHIHIPANFTEFIETAQVLKDKDIALMVYPGQHPGYIFEGFFCQGLLIEGGEEIFEDINNFKPGVFQSEPFLKCMNKIEILSKTENAILDGALMMNHIESQLCWLERKAAFIPNGLWLENEMKQDIPGDFEMAFIPSIIQDKRKNYVICATSNSLCLASKGNTEAAKAWLAFLYRKDILRKFTQIVGIPTAYKMDLSDFNISYTIKNVQMWIADLNTKLVPLSSYGDERVRAIILNALTLVISGELSAEEACSQIQLEADKIAAQR